MTEMLLKALATQVQAAERGFEWAHKDHALDKVFEELDELKVAYQSGDRNDTVDELGDVLYALVSFARVMQIDPTQALHHADEKFKARFSWIEKAASKSLNDLNHQEWRALWQQAKKELSI